MATAPTQEGTYGMSPYVVFRYQIAPEILTWNEVGTHRMSYKESDYQYRITRERHAREATWKSAYQQRNLYSKFGGKQLQNKTKKDSLAHANFIRRIESFPDTFTIVVGVVDNAAYHEGIDMRALRVNDNGEKEVDYESDKIWRGKDYSYEDFFKILCNVGNGDYDPLIIYRDSDSRRKAESSIGLRIEQYIAGSESITKKGLEDLLRHIGRDLRDSVRDYMRSGEKPINSSMTTNVFRPAKEELNDNLYGFGGDGGSLIETGQLLFAIDYEVYLEQSEHMKKYVHEMKRHKEGFPVEFKKVKTGEVVKKVPRKKNATTNWTNTAEYESKLARLEAFKCITRTLIFEQGRDISKWGDATRKQWLRDRTEMESISKWLSEHGRRI